MRLSIKYLSNLPNNSALNMIGCEGLFESKSDDSWESLIGYKYFNNNFDDGPNGKLITL